MPKIKMGIKHFLLKAAVWMMRASYALIKLFPTQNKVVLLSRQSNTPSIDFILLSQEIKNTYPNTKTVLLTRKIDKPFYLFHIILQMYHIATSRVAILDSYCIPISTLKHKNNLKVVQIWHALGSMKKFGYAMLDKPEGNSSQIASILCMHRNYDYILISSLNFIDDFVQGFGTTGDNVVEIPLPKVDLLTDQEYVRKKREELLTLHKVLNGKINILYCSTFRKNQSADSSHIDKLAACIDFQKYNLIYKPHSLNNIKTTDPRIFTDFNDTFEALFVADFVITDYSSIIYEIGLLGLPVFIYAYDWQEYKLNREFNIDFEKDVPTLFTANPKVIMEAIEKNSFDYKAFNAFVMQNVTLREGSCTKEIIKLFAEDLTTQKSCDK